MLKKHRKKSINKVSDSVSVSDSVIFRDSVSVSVETQNHGFGRSLQNQMINHARSNLRSDVTFKVGGF